MASMVSDAPVAGKNAPQQHKQGRSRAGSGKFVRTIGIVREVQDRDDEPRLQYRGWRPRQLERTRAWRPCDIEAELAESGYVRSAP